MNKKLYVLGIAVAILALSSGCVASAEQAPISTPPVIISMAYRLNLADCHQGSYQVNGDGRYGNYVWVYTNSKPVLSSAGGFLTIDLKDYYWSDALSGTPKAHGPHDSKTIVVAIGGGGFEADECSVSIDTSKDNFPIEVIDQN